MFLKAEAGPAVNFAPGACSALPVSMKSKTLTAPGIPRRSPIQVLTRPDPAWLPRSDEIGRVQSGMAVSERERDKYPL